VAEPGQGALTAGRLARFVDALNRMDGDAVERFLVPDAVWEIHSLGLRLSGVGAIREFVEEWEAAYESFATEVAEARILGADIAIIEIRQKGRVKSSAGEASQRIAWVTTWSQGLVARIDGYQHADEARAAAERLAESSR